jgi:hypothetical protein
MPQMDLPRHLAHQPVFALPYFNLDGSYARDTDCQFLSVGWAQYDAHDISAKALRYPEQRWSRQSEELPLHRLVDLTILLALCLRDPSANAIPIPSSFFENQPESMTIERVEQGPLRREAFSRTLLGNDIMRRRLGKLADVLIELRSQQII